MLSKLDVKEAFRQVLVDPSRAAYFGYTFGDIAVVDLCLEFGWRSSPGFWGLLASALEHSHNHTSFFTHAVTDIGRRDAQPIHMAPLRTGRVAQLPPDCKTVQGLGGGVGDPFFMCIYVDDSILVEVQYSPDGRRCLCASRSLISDHYRLLGERGVDDPPLLDAKKMSDWDTRLEVLGWVIDTESLTISLSEAKITKLQNLVLQWPRDRKCASVRDILSLTGFLLHVSYVLRPGKFFVHRMLASAGVRRPSSSQVVTGDGF